MEKNLFWTGGFDSTFRLLELVNDDKISKINLFYIALNIDDIESSSEYRLSITNELKAMSKILSLINTSKLNLTIFAKSENLLMYSFILPFRFVNFIGRENIEYSDKVKVNQFDLWSIGIIPRPVNQYGAISQILDEINIEAEVGIEKEGGVWSNTFYLFESIDINNKIKFKPFKGISAFERYQLPLYNISREEMLEKSKKWIPILTNTWSCWYPENDQECQSCFACLRRLELNI